ncbi:galactose-3-O-sulfotransferase 2-like isoform X1 [Acropora millepora]|uniref:galactose-3-O-sulfotransferase 2-like isoform X1 n=1 Tax=Acropora millepora TaxID=45264 RepID=UPI001CF5FE3F|nr:galactose-3-O-sulfotransferase 2-like isoform X1 [Acropora millepora]
MKIMIRRKLLIHFYRLKPLWVLLISVTVVISIALILRVNGLEKVFDCIFPKPITERYQNGMESRLSWAREFEKEFQINLGDAVNSSTRCKPVNKILFLKTHKTGSSTVTNILNRYGDNRNLWFALPVVENAFHFFWPHPFLLRYVLAFGRQPNILCNHARYNKEPMHWLFPKETTRYVTILREPREHFECIFNFFKLQRYFDDLRNFSNPLEVFLHNPEFHLAKLHVNVTGPLNLLKNPMLFELGLDTEHQKEFAVVRNYIRFLQQEFDLVMLMEYFDESLVLLKRRFCWTIKDILYFKLNERRNKDKQNISKYSKERIQEWNFGDVLLYNVFNRTLWEMIRREGPGFFKDLELFRKAKETMTKACLREGNFLTRPYSGRFVKGYELKRNISSELDGTCNKMIMNEIPFVNHHRSKMVRLFQRIDSAKNRPNFSSL